MLALSYKVLHTESPASPGVGKHVPEQSRGPEMEARVCENDMYHKGGIPVWQRKIIYSAKWHSELAIWEKCTSHTKMNSRWIPHYTKQTWNETLRKFKRVINLGVREAFLNMTENSDAINEKADIFDNIQFNFFIQQKQQHEFGGNQFSWKVFAAHPSC